MKTVRYSLQNACIEQHRTQDSSIMKGPAEMSAPMLGSLLVAVAGWCLAAYLSIKLWAANDYIRLLQANKTHQTDAE